jgi:hypothetical protein
MSNGNGHHWSKFWWADWQADAALRMCSLAAQGLWMRYLCMAHAADPIGHVLVNGQRPGARQLAAVFGITEKELTKHTAELEANGVFSRRDDGTIYCRRMVRDEERSDDGRTYVARRWGKEKAPPPNTPPNRGPSSKPNGAANRDPTTRRLEAEAEAEPPRSPPASRGGARRGKNAFHQLAREFDAEMAERATTIDGTVENVENFDAWLLRLKDGSNG